ncbi:MULTISPECIES: hypothetical protein [Myroides]|uniref:Uncharacterized protein n=1 Tax=Myroides albus TaxID=2562892 RepID=A0A6I3LKQ1_9FLAO|nr:MULTISPECIES: hypothetical protein [Myroides]MTG98394.1 hypothetical protein [Myroides albus]MVX36636.1 hypothetical protein [Myroides sp. LoEW2-1]UVD79695.1 hypothetical protein NWE55_16490 [Myroides albus]
MVDIETYIRNSFSLEMKTKFSIDENEKFSEFDINSWIFIPNSLDINSSTYSKNQFYSDVKSKVRFITPIYRLEEIVNKGAIPYNNLRAAMLALCQTLDIEKKEGNLYEYEFQLKMFMAIFRSAIRDFISEVKQANDLNLMKEKVQLFIDSIEEIRTKFRQLRDIISYRQEEEQVYNYFNFSDEFLSYAILQHSFLLLNYLEASFKNQFSDLIIYLKDLILTEKEYMAKNGYVDLIQGDKENNQKVIYRHLMLNKYIESDLILNSTKKRDGDGVLVQQIYYSLAAGTSMIFATIVAFSFQQKYGNFTMPLFVALVISYILKDRIKELMRFYFAGKLGGKYFDHKTAISIKDEKVGWIKEAVDFITDDKVPEEVLNIRSRSALLEVENKIHNEKIILYRKKVRLDNINAMKEETYSFEGINDIVNFNITRIAQRMDNPHITGYTLSELSSKGQVEMVLADKVYYLNVIVQFKNLDQVAYRRFRMLVQRTGIQKIEELPIEVD